MALTGLQKFKARLGIGAGLLVAVVAATVLSGCVVYPAYGPGYYQGGRGYYGPSNYYRDRDYYYRGYY